MRLWLYGFFLGICTSTGLGFFLLAYANFIRVFSVIFDSDCLVSHKKFHIYVHILMGFKLNKRVKGLCTE